MAKSAPNPTNDQGSACIPTLPATFISAHGSKTSSSTALISLKMVSPTREASKTANKAGVGIGTQTETFTRVSGKMTLRKARAPCGIPIRTSTKANGLMAKRTVRVDTSITMALFTKASSRTDASKDSAP